MADRAYCCYIGQAESPCLATPRFVILPAKSQPTDQETHACTLHVGYLLDDHPDGHLVQQFTAPESR